MAIRFTQLALPFDIIIPYSKNPCYLTQKVGYRETSSISHANFSIKTRQSYDNEACYQ